MTHRNSIRDIDTLRMHTWIDIDTDAVESNIHELSVTARQNGKDFMLMVKANGYGHGLIETARIGERTGARFLGVAHLGEAAELRQADIETDIMLFTEPPLACLDDVEQLRVVPVIHSTDFLKMFLNRAGKYRRPFHLKINSGLNRYGLSMKDIPYAIELLHESDISPQGLLTHYSSAPDDPVRTEGQYRMFTEAVALFERAGRIPKFTHASNSAATLWMKETMTNLVRLGLAAYGLQPSAERSAPIRPALTWLTRLTSITEIPVGQTVGYGGTWAAPRDIIAGVMPVGYSDGLRRGPRNPGRVLLAGRSVPIIGNVMMSHTILDISMVKDEVTVGDEIVIIGRQGNEVITPESVASEIGTNNEEVVTTISPLIKRHYTKVSQ